MLETATAYDIPEGEVDTFGEFLEQLQYFASPTYFDDWGSDPREVGTKAEQAAVTNAARQLLAALVAVGLIVQNK